MCQYTCEFWMYVQQQLAIARHVVVWCSRPRLHPWWLLGTQCRDWYVSVGISSISPTFPRVPFHSNILSDASLTILSPAILVRRYSGTLECLVFLVFYIGTICLSLSYHHPFHYFLVPSSFLATCLPRISAISSLFLFRSF